MKTNRSILTHTVSLVLALTLVAQAAVAQGGNGDGSAWTPELSMKYKTIRGTAMSPDGKLVAYVVREPVMEGEKLYGRGGADDGYLSQIWIVSATGKLNVQYTTAEKSSSNPSFSPDGKYLAFTSSRSGKNQIWMMRVQGGEAFQLTNGEKGVGSYRWSPDGSLIAYTMQDPDSPEEKKAKKEKRDVILVDKNFKYSHLYTVAVAENDSGGHDTQRLTAGQFHVTSFDWSPDGKFIAFTHQPDPRINTGGIATDISVVPADSGAVRLLIRRPGADGNPRYSPDGGTIAFISHGGTPQRIGLGDVYVVSARGGEPSKLADTPDRSARMLGWTADGRSILVTEAVRTTRQVVSVPVDGSATSLLGSGDGVLGSVSLDRQTVHMAFTYQEPEMPADVYVSPVRQFHRTKLTAVNAGVPRPAMGKTELIRWQSKDGLAIEGLLTYPVGYQKGRRYPLILNVHGGPAGVYSRSFTGNASVYMLQYFAQNGFAILRPNPRGSSGYGKEFRYANYKDWGFGDYEDVMSGVDQVIAMGVAHPDSLALMGWSYGGYMTSFIVTRTNRFKAASMGAGLPNLISMVTTTDIPDYLVAHMGGEFWNDYKTYQEHSAIYRIKNVTTPTQVIHGARDLRVPTTQGQEFYVALSRRGVPTEMIVYPRTPHGPREPKFVMDVSHRIMTWFSKYLARQLPTATTGR
ncbi:MAG: prolyl oligopeptidase family serine peptidase [Gemmatimonadales bacterium]